MQRASISGCVAPDGDATSLGVQVACCGLMPSGNNDGTAVCQTGSEIGLDCSRGSCVSFQEASAVTPPTPGVTPAVALVGNDCVDGAVDGLAQTPDIQARICAPRMRPIALLLLALLALLMVSAMRHMISDTPAASAEALSNPPKHEKTSTASTQFSSHARRAHRNDRVPPPSTAPSAASASPKTSTLSMQSMAQTHKPGPRPPRAQANKQQQHAQLASLEAKATAGGKAASEVKAAAEKAAAEAKAAAEEAAAEAKLEQLANATSLLNTTAPTAKQIRTFERQCAIEGTACSCAGQVRYGLGSVWSAYRASTGAIACTNKVFGDVLIGVPKVCRCKPSDTDELAVANASNAQGWFQLVRLRDHAARCMDGSLGTYYIDAAIAGSVHNSSWLIHLGNGGICDTKQSCASRVHNWDASSKRYTTAKEIKPTGLIGSNELSVWNRVHIPYCSQDLWTGRRTTASNQTWGMYFSGHNILAAVLDDLDAQLVAATSIVLSGESAGGIGVWPNVDWLAARYPNAHVVGAPIGGVYLPTCTTGPSASA